MRIEKIGKKIGRDRALSIISKLIALSVYVYVYVMFQFVVRSEEI